MAERASNGESTIFKGADGRWHGYVSVGFTVDGKPVSFDLVTEVRQPAT